MVEGIPPREASDRLNLFQTQFDELWRRFQIFSGGEELFGLSVTDYPELNRIRKELNLLQKLYQLYNAVMDSIDGYYDILWTEVTILKHKNIHFTFYRSTLKKLTMKFWTFKTNVANYPKQ